MTLDPESSSELVQVHAGSGGPGIAALIESILASEQIPCIIKSESAIAMAPQTSGPMGFFQVFVRRDQAPRAIKLIQQAERSTEGTTLSNSDYQGLRRPIRPSQWTSQTPVPAIWVLAPIAALLLISEIVNILSGGTLWRLMLPSALLIAVAAGRSRY